MASRSLEGKNAIVTGGSRGIGKGIALDLARRGANVLVTYNSSPAPAEKVASQIRTQPEEESKVDAFIVEASGTDPKAPKAIVEAAVSRWGKIDIIVNNAGAREDYALEEMTLENWESQLNTNLRFPVFLIKEAAPHFGPAPRIVNISSSYAVDGHTGSLAYVAAKGSIESVTRSFARELGHKYNATVNCVRPGPVNTELWARSIQDPGVQKEWEPTIKGTPAAPRVAEVEDVANVVGFLVEEGSRWVTGQVVNASGGLFFE
ncbi:SDR family NAD(P)-dependent oxidoreductase [Aspergillus undulatus]|uniref:SDR family NAD(P)-dependent oxidoreductase n=1 Tax=Aspergillus undulatus TaxID=1810928 RepID=UPI003CCE052E